MGKNTPLKLDEQEQILRDLENKLQSALQPVSPRSEFVRDLRYRLDRQPVAAKPASEKKELKFYLIAGASLLSGTFVLVLFVRGLISLLGGLGLLHDENTGIEHDPIAPLQPVV